jgi:UDP-N-acetylmuramoylalanine--D-glutamate ligase
MMTTHSKNSTNSIVSQYQAATVLGLGATGFSVVRYLRARGIAVTVVDSNASPALAGQLSKVYPEVIQKFGGLHIDQLTSADLIVASPGVALAEPEIRAAKQNGAQVVGDIELFLRENTKPVIAITGSNGKSTVTTLVGEMCRSGGKVPLVAGNIGLPALDALTDQTDYDVAILELSSFQLETTTQVPAEAAAILNISADHMDRYDSMGDYVLAKARILRGAQRAVLPRHDEQLRQITSNSKLLSFDLDEPANDEEYGLKRQSNNRWLMKGESRLMKLREVPLVGLHNIKNVLSAFALVEFLSLPLECLVTAVKDFRGLAHRMQTVATKQGITFVNDSKATNIGASSTALMNLESDVVWIAGGQGKGADFSDLRDAINSNIKLLVLIGEDAGQMEQSLQGLLPIVRVNSMKEAVSLAADRAVAPSIVLLSPACASFDMFDNFEQRGDLFVHEVNRWIARGAA